MTLPFHARDAVRWTGGCLRQGSPEASFAGVSIDTRSLQRGQLFVAIRGPNHDAHEFLTAALSAGAAGFLVESHRPLPSGCPDTLAVVECRDTTRGLSALAEGHRASFRGPVVAVTGSNGKTTTKEMCAAILGRAAPCLRNRGNLNNQYGLPLTLLERDERHRSVVVEIGMNHRGEIGPLAALARPSVGVITNVGTAHIEHLGSREAIAREKGDLVAALPCEGTAVLNAEDPLVLAQRERCVAKIVSFGRGGDVRAERVTTLAEHGFAFELETPWGRAAVQLAGLGETTVSNALAAAAAGLAAGATLDDVAAGLGDYRPVDGRLQRMALPRNIILINDTYNANPQSMEVALHSLATLKGSSRGIAVLGDMGELGEAAPEAHRVTGRRVAELGIDLLFALGAHAGELAEAALKAGMDPDRVHVCRDHAEIGASLREVLRGNDWILVKGSRAMRMERVVEALTHEEGG